MVLAKLADADVDAATVASRGRSLEAIPCQSCQSSVRMHYSPHCRAQRPPSKMQDATLANASQKLLTLASPTVVDADEVVQSETQVFAGKHSLPIQCLLAGSDALLGLETLVQLWKRGEMAP